MFGDNHGRRINSSIEDLNHLFGKYSNVELVGVLARHLKDETAVAYERALVRLLPKLQVTQGHLLDRKARTLLNWALLGGNRLLVLAILHAYRKVGDRTSIRSVSKLASGRALASSDQEVRDSAAGCLLVLQARAEIQEDDGKEQSRIKSLLRPSTPESEEGTLLRVPKLTQNENEGLLIPANSDSM